MSDSEANNAPDESEQNSDPDYQEDQEVYRPTHTRKQRKRFSTVWNNFTILNAKEYHAECNICHSRMSYRTTVTNLKKHLIRKHNYDCSVIPHKSKPKERTITPTPRRPNLTEMGGLEGMLLDIAGEDGAKYEEQNMENVEERVVYRDVDGHDYCIMDGTQVETQAEQEGDQTTTPKITGLYSYSPGINRTSQETSITKPQPTNKFQERLDRNKRTRLMDLQLGCLEIKKYNMQMEALMLEHQLNLPRSIHTETLRRSDTMTRSTQTEVGGNNTKVFYVSDNGAFRDGSQNFFTFQARLDDN